MRAVLVAALVLLAATACAGDDSSSSAPTTAAEAPTTSGAVTVDVEPTDYPPNDVAALKAIFDPVFEPLGLRMTRGALVDRTDGYETSDTGTHLALYVEPIDDATFDDQRYLDGILDVAAVVTPAVFDSFSAVESYDICQEPPQEVDSRYSPFPVTQIELTRANAGSIDWSTMTLVDFVTLLRTEDGASINVGADLAQSEPYEALMAEAGFLPGN